jgi:hypothetical protein
MKSREPLTLNRRADFPVRLPGGDAGKNARVPFGFDVKNVDTLIENFGGKDHRKGLPKEEGCLVETVENGVESTKQ